MNWSAVKLSVIAHGIRGKGYYALVMMRWLSKSLSRFFLSEHKMIFKKKLKIIQVLKGFSWLIHTVVLLQQNNIL